MKVGDRFEVDQYGRQHLKQTLPNGIKLYREGGWGGNGFGDWSRWYAVAPSGTVIAEWAFEDGYHRTCKVLGKYVSGHHFKDWKAAVSSLTV